MLLQNQRSLKEAEQKKHADLIRRRTERLSEMESRSYILILFHSLVFNVAKSGG